MSTWLERNWSLLTEQVWGIAETEVGEDSDYLEQDIGPVLYAINPEREKLERSKFPDR